jgi:ArsR family transcriptional regulator
MPKAKTTRNPTDAMFRAFADRTRLRILSILDGSESCVGDIVDTLQIEQPKVSRHLAYLRRAGLVVVRRAGLWSYYSLAPARDRFHQKLLECLSCHSRCATDPDRSGARQEIAHIGRLLPANWWTGAERRKAPLLLRTQMISLPVTR